MPPGPSVYDPFATYVRTQTHARGVVIIVMDGDHGNGVAVQATPDIAALLPDLLEFAARTIRESLPGSTADTN